MLSIIIRHACGHFCPMVLHSLNLVKYTIINIYLALQWKNDVSCILSPHLFNIYTEQVMCKSDIDDMGLEIGGRNIEQMYQKKKPLQATVPVRKEEIHQQQRTLYKQQIRSVT